MEIIDYSKIFVNNIIGFYGISNIEFYNDLKKNKLFEQKVSHIDSNDVEFYTNTLKSEIKLNIKNKLIDKEVYIGLMNKYCKMLFVEEGLINKKIINLSSSEKYKLYIILNLLLDSQIYIFSNIYRYLDKTNTKRLFEVLKELKERGKTIIIFDNVDRLYDITDYVYLTKENKVTISGKTKEVFTDVEALLKNGFDVPKLPMITYLAKKEKKIKLFYHNDVRDIIKDVYKHV